MEHIKELLGQNVVITAFFKTIKVINKGKRVLIVEKATINRKPLCPRMRVEYIVSLKNINIFTDDLISISGILTYNEYAKCYEIVNTQFIRLIGKYSPYWNNTDSFMKTHTTFKLHIKKRPIDEYNVKRYHYKTIETITPDDELQFKYGDVIILYLREITEDFELKFYWQIQGVPVIHKGASVNILTCYSLVIQRKYLLPIELSALYALTSLVVQNLFFKPLVEIPYKNPNKEYGNLPTIKTKQEKLITHTENMRLISHYATLNYRYKLLFNFKSCLSELSNEQILDLFNKFDFFKTKNTNSFFVKKSPVYQNYEFLRNSISAIVNASINETKVKVYDYCCELAGFTLL